MSKPTVVISGGGVTGACLAYLLGKHNFHVTVLERSAKGVAEQGQIIDVEGPARKVMERMGLIDRLREFTTKEEGIKLVDADSRTLAFIPVGETSASNELELMRSDLVRVLYEAATQFSNVTFRYGCSIESIQQTSTNVTVEVKDRDKDTIKSETYDFLVACDGLRSRTRDMILDPTESENCIKALKLFIAFFSIPAESRDRPFQRFYHAPGRRGILCKPYSEKESSMYVMLGSRKDPTSLREARLSRDIQRQKEIMRDIFEGAGWETERFLKGMMETQNFYFEEISQVHLSKWHKGRCILLGDTAYAPSPLTGQGTNLAIMGAYTLAFHLVKQKDQLRHSETLTAAFEAYEKQFRPYVDKTQPLPLGGDPTYFTLPETSWGIWAFRWSVWLVAATRFWKWFPTRIFDIGNVPYELPDLEC